jgi:hypothetical protein
VTNFPQTCKHDMVIELKTRVLWYCLNNKKKMLLFSNVTLGMNVNWWTGTAAMEIIMEVIQKPRNNPTYDSTVPLLNTYIYMYIQIHIYIYTCTYTHTQILTQIDIHISKCSFFFHKLFYHIIHSIRIYLWGTIWNVSCYI